MSRGFTVAKNPARQRARQRILDEANAARNRGGRVSGMLRMRHLQQAVAIVRSRGLVKDSVLLNAGFNARKVPQDRRASGSPSTPPEGDRTAVEQVSDSPPLKASGRRARRRASVITDPQARARVTLAASDEDPTRDPRAVRAGSGAAGPRPGPRDKGANA